MGITARIAPFGNLKIENFSPWGWELRRKSPQKRFIDGNSILALRPMKTPSPKNLLK
jgi:hypothetical protein